MSVSTVSTGQALMAIDAALTKDSVEREGKLALQLIQATTTNQTEMNSNKPNPSERIGSHINIAV